jgi:hypothetical protein
MTADVGGDHRRTWRGRVDDGHGAPDRVERWPSGESARLSWALGIWAATVNVARCPRPPRRKAARRARRGQPPIRARDDVLGVPREGNRSQYPEGERVDHGQRREQGPIDHQETVAGGRDGERGRAHPDGDQAEDRMLGRVHDGDRVIAAVPAVRILPSRQHVRPAAVGTHRDLVGRAEGIRRVAVTSCAEV